MTANNQTLIYMTSADKAAANYLIEQLIKDGWKRERPNYPPSISELFRYLVKQELEAKKSNS